MHPEKSILNLVYSNQIWIVNALFWKFSINLNFILFSLNFPECIIGFTQFNDTCLMYAFYVTVSSVNVWCWVCQQHTEVFFLGWRKLHFKGINQSYTQHTYVHASKVCVSVCIYYVHVYTVCDAKKHDAKVSLQKKKKKMQKFLRKIIAHLKLRTVTLRTVFYVLIKRSGFLCYVICSYDVLCLLLYDMLIIYIYIMLWKIYTLMNIFKVLILFVAPGVGSREEMQRVEIILRAYWACSERVQDNIIGKMMYQKWQVSTSHLNLIKCPH